MLNMLIHAYVTHIEADGTRGAHYPVNLEVIPRVGELMEILSYLETDPGHTMHHFYEVVQIVHQVHDVAERGGLSLKSHQFVSIFVRSIQKPLYL